MGFLVQSLLGHSRISGSSRAGARPAVDPGPGRSADRAAVRRLYTLRGVSFLPHRLGFSPQVPAHLAFERDEDAIAAWRTATWAKVRG
jgi:hypothetical protein